MNKKEFVLYLLPTIIIGSILILITLIMLNLNEFTLPICAIFGFVCGLVIPRWIDKK